MKSKNWKLNKAQRDKKDEFYTLYEDVEKAVEHFKDYFKDQIVYANADLEK